MKQSEAFRQAAIETGEAPAEVDRRMTIMRTLLTVKDNEIQKGKEREVIERLKTMFVVGKQLHDSNPVGFSAAVDKGLRERSNKN